MWSTTARDLDKEFLGLGYGTAIGAGAFPSAQRCAKGTLIVAPEGAVPSNGPSIRHRRCCGTGHTLCLEYVHGGRGGMCGKDTTAAQPSCRDLEACWHLQTEACLRASRPPTYLAGGSWRLPCALRLLRGGGHQEPPTRYMERLQRDACGWVALVQATLLSAVNAVAADAIAYSVVVLHQRCRGRRSCLGV